MLQGPNVVDTTEDGSPIELYETAATAYEIADMLHRRKLSGVPWDYVTASFSERELLENDQIKAAYEMWKPSC